MSKHVDISTEALTKTDSLKEPQTQDALALWGHAILCVASEGQLVLGVK